MQMRNSTWFLSAILLIFLVSCAASNKDIVGQTLTTDLIEVVESTMQPTPKSPNSDPPIIEPTSIQSSSTSINSASSTEHLPSIDTRPLPADWQNWPVIPEVSPWLKAIYAQGLAEGNDPLAFSKIGDCQNVAELFLSPFDVPPLYRLGDKYSYLMPTIEQFSGSWKRLSQAVRGGFNVASVLSSYFSDKEVCGNNETPLECEFRLNKPSIAIISMETWTSKRPPEVFEGYLSQIVEFVLANKAIPILATKADNLEGDHSINAAIARVAYQYDVPLWNFWAALQSIPWNGLTEDKFHLTVGNNYFDDPVEMEKAWPIRNLTALQAIDAVWQALK